MKAWKAIMSVWLGGIKMVKLLSANFSRLWKDKVFWLEMFVMLVYAVVVVFAMNKSVQATPEQMRGNFKLDNYYFNFALSIGAFCALFTSLFFGTEHGDGTLRNKIVMGHTRTTIYLSNLLVSFSATLFIMLVWLIGLMAGIPVLGFLG